ncbi:CHAP domain-containing protein [Streptococcus uberis]|uniref:CHAP domain-containing protein n=2 Tax=Streptococcus uberis TaxID=1349 RepID=UPI00193947B1|nr:CHAP domain-containing protein [Streptococcus uberis]
MKKEKYIALSLLCAIATSNLSVVTVFAQDAQTVLTQAATVTDQKSDKAEEAPSTEATKVPESVSSVATTVVPEPSLPSADVSALPTDSTTAPTETVTEGSTETNPTSSTDKTASSSGSEGETQPGTQTETSKPETPAPSQPVTPVVPSQPQTGTKASQPQAPVAPQKAETVKPAIMSGIDLSDVSMPTAMASAAYVKHWTGNDAYTHNLLSHRYGITAAQLDGFLQSTGIKYDSNRINGQKILDWEKLSGLDARAIIAIAIAESSLGTQGVATAPGANMFGFGAFDNNPTNAQNFSDDKAVIKMTQETIIQNQNTSFAIQDQKAQLLSTGNLNVAALGGVYFTDASGSGKRRAAIMESIDKWIDSHGGTPEIPKELLNTSSVAMMAVPTGYSVSKANQAGNYVAGTYPWGQCTWYVFNRAKELGYQFGPFMGNGGDWKHKPGYQTTHEAKPGYAISFSPGQAGADRTYGHVAIVEDVKEDGSILISESNVLGLGIISYRTFSAAEAAQLTYVVGEK